MDVKEAKKTKLELADKIRRLINDFEEITETEVECIGVDRIREMSGYNFPMITIELKL